MQAFYLSWGAASDLSSLSEATLRRLVRHGTLTAPVRLSPGRVGFERERFAAELHAYISAFNASAPSPIRLPTPGTRWPKRATASGA